MRGCRSSCEASINTRIWLIRSSPVGCLVEPPDAKRTTDAYTGHHFDRRGRADQRPDLGPGGGGLGSLIAGVSYRGEGTFRGVLSPFFGFRARSRGVVTTRGAAQRALD